ncbi:MAG TPA: cell division protein FtsB [Steroidobacteraceae bacterium]|nr:cell division protein FtsB [Steroidobacteraceae bacterium]
MKWLAVTLGVVLVLLQYRLWFSGDGVADLWRIRAAAAQQQSANEALSERNRQLAAEVRDLKQGYAALEERARTDLNMTAGNETFYQVVPRQAGGGTQSLPAAPAKPLTQHTAAR